MAITREHELHRRRRGRNLGVAACLLVLVAVLFGLSAAKVGSLGPTEGFDHTVRPQLDLRAQDEASVEGATE